MSGMRAAVAVTWLPDEWRLRAGHVPDADKARNFAASASCASLPVDVHIGSVTPCSFPNLHRALHLGPFFQFRVGL